MNKDLKLYDLQLTDDVLGMYTISLVENPATETEWMAFSKQEEPMNFSVMDNMEHKVLCVICRADFPIYRRDESGYEYYVRFSKETIQKMAQRFLKNGFQSNINLEHQEDTYIDGVELQEIFIKNTEKGINPQGFEQIEEGSLFGIYKIENEAAWDAIMKGIFKSVSLEGFFAPVEVKEEKTIDSIKDLMDYLNKK